MFEGQDVKEKWIIILGLQMDFEVLQKLPEPEGQDAVIKTYADGNIVAQDISNWLRANGWDAQGYCGAWQYFRIRLAYSDIKHMLKA